MEERIRELEEESIHELSTYLTVSGLNNYSITDAEKKIISQTPHTEKICLEKLFSCSTGDVDLQQKDIDGKGVYFINSGVQNYGIKGKTSTPAKIFNENTITVDFFGNVYYRPFKYKLATHNHVFSLSGSIIKNDKIGLYLVTQMSYFKKMFSFNEMATWNKIKKLKIDIPILPNGSYDYEYMENYISVIEKETIKTVVDWKDKVISTTKKCI